VLCVLASALVDATRHVAPWIERLARVGYVAKALLYGTVGVLAAGAAFGHGETTDTRGAMAKLVVAPYGRFLLSIMAIGLFGYAAWRCTSAFVDPEGRGNGPKGLALRAGFLIRGIAHLALGYSAVRLVINASARSADRSRQATSAAMHLPGGVWILWVAAISIGVFGVYQLYRAAVAKLSKQLHHDEMRAEVGRWVIVVSRFGIAARGLVFVAIAWLLARAAAAHDPKTAGGIDDALASLAQLGPLPYAAIGGGLIAYGVYELLNARYRRIDAA
jgi:hypothetical protein